MSYFSPSIEKLIENFEKLPSIGHKTAVRLAFYMLDLNEERTNEFISSIINAKKNLKYCSICFNISDTNPCPVCSSNKRDKSIICVVEDVRDVMAIENTGQFKGQYHVLGGKISPMEGIGPGQLNIQTLVDRVQNENVKEIIFALSSTMEGDTTVFYLYRQLKNTEIIFSAIARGLGVGDELEYADEATLVRSIQHRIPYSENKF